MGGCFDCSSSNCPSPINCVPDKCRKDQIICINKCEKFDLTFPTTKTFLRGFSESTTEGQGSQVPTQFSGSVCITNDGPDSLILSFAPRPIDTPASRVSVVIPPQSGILVPFTNIYGAFLQPSSGNSRGQLQFEVQQIIKLNC